MSAPGRRLGDLEPRERTGAQTSRRYEYQYERTAIAALELLENPDRVCVHCDWHDDFVVEYVRGALPHYAFHQVKSKSASQGPWKLRELFGMVFSAPRKPGQRTKKSKKVATSKPRAVDITAPIPRMLIHRTSFGAFCGPLVFVTNCGLDTAVVEFIQAVHSSTSIATLQIEHRESIDALSLGYSAAKPPLTLSPGQLYDELRQLMFLTEQGNLANPDAALLEIGDKISETSEVNLQMHESKQVARGLVDVVRRKVGFTGTVVPAADEVLRAEKGVVVLDLLDVLALSRDGYEHLAKGGVDRETVKTLSRLARYCNESAELKSHMVKICAFKAQWDIWRTTERHFLDTVDYLNLETRARALLESNLSLEKLAEASKELAASFSSSSNTAAIQAEQVMGLIFSLAARSEARR